MIFRDKVGRDTKLKFYKVMAAPAPVSYTHLDVYKRQGQYRDYHNFVKL